jgi:hypothetical protein
MSLNSFLGLLTSAQAIDASTQAVRLPKLRISGCVGLVAGIALLFIPGDATTIFGGFLCLIGLVLLLMYAMAAKFYGYVAVASITLFLGGCFGIMAWARHDVYSSPAELAPQAQHPASTTPPSFPSDPVVEHKEASKLTSIDPPREIVSLEKRTTTLAEKRAEAVAAGMVFLEGANRIFHEPSCDAVTPRMVRVLPSVARMQRYAPAADCHKEQH